MDERLDQNKKHISLKQIQDLEELPDTGPIALSDENGLILYANKAFTRSFALKSEESFSSLQTEPYLPYLIDGLLASNYIGVHFDMFFNGGAEEAHQTYLVQMERIFLGGNQYLLFGFSYTVERKLIAERINNLHNALEYGNVPVIITDGEGLINYSSKSFEEILGTSIEKIYKTSIVTALGSYLSEYDKTELKRAISESSGWVKLISDRPSGGLIWFKELKLNPVRRVDKPKADFILTANDITNYVLKNRITKRSEQRQKSIINNISELLLILKNDGTSMFIENANDRFLEVFHLRGINGRAAEDCLPEEFLSLVKSCVGEIKSQGYSKSEFKYKFLELQFLVKITFADDLYSDERLFILSFNDITEQLSNEQRLREAYNKETELNRLKSAFLANMSHEIRTPLNAVVGYSDLIEDDITSKDYSDIPEIVGYLKDGVGRLLRLVDNIIQVSLLESGDDTVDMVRINLNEVLRSACLEFKGSALHRGIRIVEDFDQKIPLMLSDEYKLRKIFEMVIDNAIKYNRPNGQVKISTSVDGANFLVSIKDTGIGIEQEKLEKILEPFVQEEDEGYKRNYEGAGLGLTIAYRMTRLLKGNLIVSSKMSEGTEIRIYLPL